MFDYIKNLPDEYSIFRDSVMKNNEMRFDKVNSIPTGVDITGNTVYDSSMCIIRCLRKRNLIRNLNSLLFSYRITM